MKHRTDIDGLRAIAVLPILLFHAGLTALPGGFLGVDIFFVISGFLITSILTREIELGQFSILTFYRKRIVRIFPALFAMLAATLIAAVLLQLPSEVRDTGRSAAAAASFLSNVYFFKAVDYFGGSAELMPLLHTWSLGVEEQFYILYPLFLLIVHRFFPRHVPIALGLLLVSSLAIAFGLQMWKPEAAFYLLPARGWQLAAGGLVAVLKPTARKDGLAALGLALIAVSVVIVQNDWGVVGTLMPTVGAALLIAFGQGAVTHRLLGLSPMRWIGAVSYSLYLWHWPIIAFYRRQTGLELSLVETLGLVVASVAAAALSYYLIEQPMLKRFRNGNSRPIVLTGGAALASVVAATLFVAHHPNGWRPIPPEVQRIAAFADYAKSQQSKAQFREGVCFASAEHPNFDYGVCTKSKPGVENILLVGDSHAAQYSLALRERFPKANLMQVTASGCRIVVDADGSDRCETLAKYVYGGKLLRSASFDTAILAGRWRRSDVDELEESIDYFQDHGVQVTVIGPGYEFEGEYPLLLARAYEMGDPAIMERFRLKDAREVDHIIAAAAAKAGAKYYSVLNADCTGHCRYLADDGAPIRFDYGHVTEGGAELMMARFPTPAVAQKRS